MKIHSIKISGFRLIKNSEIFFKDATFLIGANNSGKSTVLRALELFFNLDSTSESDFYSELDPVTNEQNKISNEISMIVEFRNVSNEAKKWRGFRGRIIKIEPDSLEDTDLAITIKKTFSSGKPKIEILERKRTIKPEFSTEVSSAALLKLGVITDETLANRSLKITNNSDKAKLLEIDEVWDFGEETEWIANPGGIPQNVMAKLPRFLFIPAEIDAKEIGDSKGTLSKTLAIIFEEIRKTSKNYIDAQNALSKLQIEMDPDDINSDFGKMMAALNSTMGTVFPSTRIHAKADLSNPDTVLKPTFEIQMSSNVRTSVERQGTGMVRAAIFALLRYRRQWDSVREGDAGRSLIIGFEEPEIYLHPGAANQMRSEIYNLASGSSQIVCTTHSPYLIDLSRKPRQILNRITSKSDGVECIAFSTTSEYRKLDDDDREHIKML